MKFRTSYLFATLAFITACEANVNTDNKDDKNSQPIALTGDVEFSGFVQKAFEITVNDTSFNDSEDFYTHFIERLIAPNPKYQKALAGAKIKIEGQYGLDTFGSNAGVFVSSMEKSGHLFQSTTNGQGKFTIRIKRDAQDEQFKAKVVLRIGLQIEYPGMKDPDHFCYLLFGQKDNISVNDNSKPIIFDSFTTQLDTYRCEEHPTDKLIIPTKDGESNSGVLIPGGEGKPSEEPDNPHVLVDSPIQIAMPLSVDETGENRILSAFQESEDGAYYILKDKVTSKTSGDVYHPLVALSDLTKPSIKQLAIKRDQFDYTIGDMVKYQSNFYVSDGGRNTYPRSIGIFDNSGMFQADISMVVGSTYLFEKVLLLSTPDGVRVFGKDWSRGYKLCKLDTNSANPYTSCRTTPESQRGSVDDFRSATQYGDLLFILSKDATKITVLNQNLVQQATYTVSKLIMPKFEIDSARLFSDAKGLLFASIAADGQTLKIRRLQLVQK